jgi:hypothetical protein
MRLDSRDHVRSLAQVRRDEDVQIGYIAFDAIREQCPALGLEPGARVHCVACRDRDLVLRTAVDREVIIDRFYATFIEVQPLRIASGRPDDRSRSVRSVRAVPPSSELKTGA